MGQFFLPQQRPQPTSSRQKVSVVELIITVVSFICSFSLQTNRFRLLSNNILTSFYCNRKKTLDIANNTQTYFRVRICLMDKIVGKKKERRNVEGMEGGRRRSRRRRRIFFLYYLLYNRLSYII